MSQAFKNTACFAINHVFNLMYEYMIYVALAEDINLFLQAWDKHIDAPLLIS